MADALLYEVSNSIEMDGEPFLRRNRIYIIDQNSGSYSNNQVILDTASISNSGQWADFSSAIITVPLLITLTSQFNFYGTQQAPIATDFAVGLKNSYTQLISSMSIEYNNSSVVQISNFTNMYISYKLNTTLCVDDLVIIGTQIGFAKDTAQSWKYANVPSTAGQGSVNNFDSILSTNFSALYDGTSGNVGFAKRQLEITFTAGQVGTATILGGPTNWASVSSTYQRNFTTKSTTAINGYYQQSWNILATWRLKDLADFFEKMPLVRGAYIKMYINLNQSRTKITISENTGYISVVNSDLTVFGGNTNPLLIPSSGTNCGLEPLSNAVFAGVTDQTFTYSVSLLNSLDPNCVSPYNRYAGQSNCRLYCDLYTLNPMREEEYLTNGRTKVIKYRDIFQYQYLNAPTGSFNFLVTNGLANLVEIVVCPFISSTYNGTGNSSTSFSTLVSPFASEPATCSPLMYINNVNFQISGVNAFINNKNFGYECFQDELYGVGSVNGGKTDGLSSGLISQNDFYNNYGYLVANVSRRLPEEDRTPKSVQILGNNLTQVPIDLYVFCVLEKEITIDLYSGKRIT
jgi:hypothetical protein